MNQSEIEHVSFSGGQGLVKPEEITHLATINLLFSFMKHQLPKTENWKGWFIRPFWSFGGQTLVN